jgi:2-amino-4-hydroxy-6-hydroxymethyldihydropteridine diphosphokinase
LKKSRAEAALRISEVLYMIETQVTYGSKKRMRYFIGLGSNMGNKRRNLSQASHLLEESGIKILKKSSIYETSPVGPVEQPWFLNQVLEVETDFSPQYLLRVTKRIEKKMGRHSGVAKGPRCIDIDILLSESGVVRTKKLQVPHPELEKRKFVLIPLMEIAPETVHPLLNKKVEDLWRECQDDSDVHILEGR